MKKIFTVFLVIFSVIANFAIAQDEIAGVVVFGNQNQPGTRVHKEIQSLMLNGETLIISSESVINNALAETSVLFSPLAAQAINADKLTTIEFMRNMITSNSLFEATKASIESTPENIISIINITVSLYPDFAQDVINAAVMSGEMDSNTALIAAISAGADPATISEATAAGGNVASTLAAPVGVGVGAGGTGGGDATASTN